MRIRRTTTVLATLIGAGVLAVPMAAQAAAPFSQAGDDDDTTSVPDTIDTLNVAATRDQTAYRFTVSYDDLEKTATTDRYVLLFDNGNQGRASRIKGTFIELRTNRQSAVSVHLYDFSDSETTTMITPVSCKGVAVVPSYSGDTIRYTLPRSCYHGATKPPSAQVVVDDALFTDDSWDPAATFSATEAGPEPEATDHVGGQWVFDPAAGTSTRPTPASSDRFRG